MEGDKKSYRITAFDIIICIFVLAVTVVVCSFFYIKSLASPSYVVVTSQGEEYVYPLYKDAVYNVSGLLGDTVLEIKNKEVEILSTPCLLKTCTNRVIKKNAESLVCLPNGVSVQLKAVFEQKNDYDAIAF